MSLKFVDKVYKDKHPNSNREYYPPLAARPNRERGGLEIGITKPNTPPPIHSEATDTKPKITRNSSLAEIKEYVKIVTGFANNIRTNKPFQAFLRRSLTKAGISMGVYLLSFAPFFGRFVIPAVSFYSFNNVVGTPTAVAIFTIGLTLPRRWIFTFLSTFWGSRSLVRELLAPYFSRLPYNKLDREHWFRAREGIMFGFGAVFYLLVKIPFFGVIAYGIAEASSAYLITKVTEPAPMITRPDNFATGATSTSSDFSSKMTGSSQPTSSSPTSGVSLALLDEKWMRKELAWTNSDKLLSGYALDEDGFGNAPDIVPGGWARSSAKSTAEHIRREATNHDSSSFIELSDISRTPSVSSIKSNIGNNTPERSGTPSSYYRDTPTMASI